MKPQDQDRLLRGILEGEDVDSLRARTLELALASARARRRRRFVGQAAAGLAVALLLGLTLVWTPPRRETPLTATAIPSSPTASVAQSPAPEKAGESRIAYLSDDELLALFPNRPVALIGSPGRQQLVFLDQP